MLIIDLRGMIDDNIPVFISAAPAKWLNIVVKTVIPPKYISAVYGVLRGSGTTLPTLPRPALRRSLCRTII
jgi:hypothetical protein